MVLQSNKFYGFHSWSDEILALCHFRGSGPNIKIVATEIAQVLLEHTPYIDFVTLTLASGFRAQNGGTRSNGEVRNGREPAARAMVVDLQGSKSRVYLPTFFTHSGRGGTSRDGVRFDPGNR